MKILFAMILSFAFSAASYAGGGSAYCHGIHQGKKIVFQGTMSDVSNFDTGEGQILVDKTLVADFEGEDLKLSYIFRTFKVTNNQGAVLEGKVTSISEKKGIITKLYVPGTIVNYKNIPMSCTAK